MGIEFMKLSIFVSRKSGFFLLIVKMHLKISH